jgi:hypothetical protein
MAGGVKKIGDILSDFLKEHEDIVKNARESSNLHSGWASIVESVFDQTMGTRAAVHSYIQDLQHNTLLVEADHPGWIQILQTKEKQLLNEVHRRFPELDVTGISFRLGK